MSGVVRKESAKPKPIMAFIRTGYIFKKSALLKQNKRQDNRQIKKKMFFCLFCAKLKKAIPIKKKDSSRKENCFCKKTKTMNG